MPRLPNLTRFKVRSILLSRTFWTFLQSAATWCLLTSTRTDGIVPCFTFQFSHAHVDTKAWGPFGAFWKIEAHPIVKICCRARSFWWTSISRRPKCLKPHLGQGIGQKWARMLCACGSSAWMPNGIELPSRVEGNPPKLRVKISLSNVTRFV